MAAIKNLHSNAVACTIKLHDDEQPGILIGVERDIWYVQTFVALMPPQLRRAISVAENNLLCFHAIDTREADDIIQIKNLKDLDVRSARLLNDLIALATEGTSQPEPPSLSLRPVDDRLHLHVDALRDIVTNYHSGLVQFDAGIDYGTDDVLRLLQDSPELHPMAFLRLNGFRLHLHHTLDAIPGKAKIDLDSNFRAVWTWNDEIRRELNV